MKCLFVKPPFAGYIVDGIKLIEYRTRKIYIRGRIGIIESGTGTIIGDVEIVDCRFDSTFQLYEWYLDNPRRFATPVPFEHKQGAMVWIDLDIDLKDQKTAPGLSDDEWNHAVYQWPAKMIVAAKRGYTTRVPYIASKEVKAQAKEVFF